MSHVVVKIGGCNGSGKTSLARAAIYALGLVPLYPPQSKKIECYTPQQLTMGPQFVVLGSYVNVCGGMDTISDKHDRLGLVERWAKKGNITIFEGLITGKTYGALGALSDEPKQKGHWIYAFMDTPFDVCVERVMQRRHAKDNFADFDPERTMRPTFKSCEATARRAHEAGHKVVMVNHKHSPAKAAKVLLSKALELYHAG